MRFGKYDTFSFVDVETTGTAASIDRVLEIGIIRVENGNIVGELNTLLDPGVYIPPEITSITGITEKDILNSPTFPDIIDKVEELLKDSVFVAHNARFDHAFIRHEFRRLGMPFKPKTLDTVKLSRKLYPFLPRHNLDSIITFLGTKIEKRHRAYDDAYVLYELLNKIHTDFEAEETSLVFSEMLKSPSLPQNISKKQIEELPESPGVYLIYGVDDTLLYVGKSVDIRARVLSHFYNDFESSTDLKLSREATKIEYIKTAGDLGASLLEANLIKTLHPVHNRALRKGLGLLFAVEKEVAGYLSIEIKPQDKLTKEDISHILLVSSNKRQLNDIILEKAKEHKLCLKILGLEKGKGRCFGYQIDQCLGACVGEEPPHKFNVRFVEAFYEKRVKPWPFNGPVGVKEKFEDTEEIYVVNNWCYLGSIKTQYDEIEELLKKEPIFSWDNYKIVSRFLKKEMQKNRIMNFSLPSHSFPTEQL